MSRTPPAPSRASATSRPVGTSAAPGRRHGRDRRTAGSTASSPAPAGAVPARGTPADRRSWPRPPPNSPARFRAAGARVRSGFFIPPLLAPAQQPGGEQSERDHPYERAGAPDRPYPSGRLHRQEVTQQDKAADDGSEQDQPRQAPLRTCQRLS